MRLAIVDSLSDTVHQLGLRECEAACYDIGGRAHESGKDSLPIRNSRFLIQPSRLCHQIIPFWNTCRPARRSPVVLSRVFMIAKHFEQMSTNRVKTVVLGNPA